MAGLLADTHAVIWYLLDSARLSPTALAKLESCREDGVKVGVASISIVEMVYLVDKGRVPPKAISLLLEGIEPPLSLLEVVPLTQSIALAVREVPRERIPDLPDRVIAATALHMEVPLITRDRKIHLPQLATIW